MLRDTMNNLIDRLTRRVKQLRGDGNCHQILLHETAEMYDLYDESELAPVWLSRVIAGVMQDEGVQT